MRHLSPIIHERFGLSGVRYAIVMLRREWRAGDLRIVALALVLAVACATSVAAFTDRLQQALQRQGGELLAADLVVHSSFPPQPAWRERAISSGLAVARTTSMRSVVVAGRRTRLTEIKAVSAGYPLRGQLRVAASTRGIDMANNAYMRDGGLSGLATGFADLDQRMGGLQPSDLIIVAGRPAMGKTALATNIAYHIAKSYRTDSDSEKTVDGAVVGFFSLEMSAEQLATRILSEQSLIPSNEIRRGKIDDAQFRSLIDVAQDLERLPLYIDQTGGITVAQLAARARRLKRQRDIGLIVVDYLQLLSGSSRRAADGRVQEITEITTSLKALAKELNVPVLALSQLSRQVEQREDKRPLLSDLRESGSIEQDADVVLFVYREEYYHERREPSLNTEEHAQWRTQMESLTGQAEIIIGKQRHGPTGTVKLQFTSEFTRFSNLAEPDRLPERRE